jgi:hypothetical protein
MLWINKFLVNICRSISDDHESKFWVHEYITGEKVNVKDLQTWS